MHTSMRLLRNTRLTLPLLKWVSVFSFGCISTSAWAVVLDNQTLTVSSGTPLDSYVLINQSALTVDGAQTSSISVTDSVLSILRGDTLTSNSVAINLVDSQASIANATITSRGSVGLLLAHGAGDGSTASVSNSTIQGGSVGIQVNAGGELTLANSQVSATAANSDGLRLQGGTAQVSNSSIIGQNFGVRMLRESELRPDVAALRLDNSSVSSVTGNGIEVRTRGDAIIDMQNGSRVSAGNGTAINISEFSNTTLTAGASEIEGNIVVAEGGRASLGLDNSRLVGDIQSGGTTAVDFNQSVLEGDVTVAAAGTANVSFNQSSMIGNLVAQEGGDLSLVLAERSQLAGNVQNAQLVSVQGGSLLVGDLDRVQVLSLDSNAQFTGKTVDVQQAGIGGGANWTMTDTSSVGSLAMNGGQVTFGDNATFYRLNVENLSGNGTFVMASDFSNGNTDFLNVTGNASGSHGLLMGSNGADPSLDSLKVVHMGSGDAQFSLLNQGEQVDLGAYSYKLVQKGDQDWYLDRETRTISPMTRTVMALFNTPITIAYGEMTSLRSRMGELRYNQGKNAGVWMRAYGNQHNIADASSGVGYQQNQRGLTFGADAQLGESNWTLGLLAGHSRSDLNLSYGSSGSIDSYYVGGYATWMDPESGYYVDSVLKYNRYQNDAKVGLSDGTRTKGDYDTHGMSASVEVGKHIKLDDGYFIEPFAQVAAAAVAGKDFTLDNGFDANGDVSRSLLGKVGTTLGKTISLGGDSMIQPYVKAAFAHEFAQRNQVQVNNNLFNNDLSGSRAELGAGVAWTVAKDFQVYGEAGYMNGKNIEMPYSFSLGASYRF
ncbi:hypothetical protein B8W70_24225 [Pseudomonas sp. 1239]|nr:hypothetical protein B8W70_24225 [Pseudomonas sp. 1239]